MERITSEEVILQLENENKELVQKIDSLNARIERLALINEDLYLKYKKASDRLQLYEASETRYRRLCS